MVWHVLVYYTHQGPESISYFDGSVVKVARKVVNVVSCQLNKELGAT